MALQDSRIVLLTGDLGFGVLDEYQRLCPNQFVNVGVAEQNLTGIAAGLALSGHVVITYSIANFPTLRALEQVRNDVCYHEANVKIVSVGGGLAYGALGPSHFATEDLAILRALPSIAVVAPGDPVEVEQLVPQIISLPGPAYIRLGRAGEPRFHDDNASVVLGRPNHVRRGQDVLFLTIGGILGVALEAAAGLSAVGVEAEVVSVHTLRPLDTRGVVELARTFPLVVTCEEHSVVGGLGGAVAEILMEAGVSTRFRRFGLTSGFPRGIGSQEYLREQNGLGPAALQQLVLAELDSLSK